MSERISPDELVRLMESDRQVIVVDVRDKERFDAGHVPGARHIPKAQIEANTHDLPKDSLIVTY